VSLKFLCAVALLPVVIEIKKLISVIAIVAILTVAMLCVGVVSSAVTGASSPGPAPNSGDGISDGSGFEGSNEDGSGVGPAPNSGDGIPDGSGF